MSVEEQYSNNIQSFTCLENKTQNTVKKIKCKFYITERIPLTQTKNLSKKNSSNNISQQHPPSLKRSFSAVDFYSKTSNLSSPKNNNSFISKKFSIKKHSLCNCSSAVKLTPYQKILNHNKLEKEIRDLHIIKHNKYKLSNEPFVDEHFNMFSPRKSPNELTKKKICFFKMKNYFNHISNRKLSDLSRSSTIEEKNTITEKTKMKIIKKKHKLELSNLNKRPLSIKRNNICLSSLFAIKPNLKILLSK